VAWLGTGDGQRKAGRLRAKGVVVAREPGQDGSGGMDAVFDEGCGNLPNSTKAGGWVRGRGPPGAARPERGPDSTSSTSRAGVGSAWVAAPAPPTRGGAAGGQPGEQRRRGRPKPPDWCHRQRRRRMSVRHVNPEGLHRSPAFSQAVVVEQPTKTIYVGGQNGVDADGKVVGPTVAEQASQALRNLATVLESEGASLANVVHWRIAVVDGHAFDEGLAAFQQAWNPADPPPAITVHVVAGLGPEFLVEIDAVAVI
jgi:enamine deaminase RidA (YjgF/YER057c/UK114 family)